MKEFFYTSTYNFFTKEEIISKLGTESSQYIKKFYFLQIENNNYEEALVKKGVKYFAYIKFFFDGKDSYGIVAGKSGSKLVNKSSGTDINFSLKDEDGPSRRFLNQNHFNWDESKVLICEGHFPDDPKDALAICKSQQKNVGYRRS